MMTPAQGTMLNRRMHWKFDPITNVQYEKLAHLVLMSKLTKSDASLLIGALIDVEANNNRFDDVSEAEKAKAINTIQTTLSKYV